VRSETQQLRGVQALTSGQPIAGRPLHSGSREYQTAHTNTPRVTVVGRASASAKSYSIKHHTGEEVDLSPQAQETATEDLIQYIDPEKETIAETSLSISIPIGSHTVLN
jgi:hypothetical protein